MNTNADILLSQFGSILHVRPEQVAYQVMMLPDAQYHTRFAQLSLELNVDVNTLKQQFVEVAMTQLVNKQTRYLPEADSQESAGKKKVRQTYQRAIKQEYQQFQQLYAEKLFQVLRSADGSAVFTNDRELCSQVNEHLASHGQKTFWASLQALMPSKTVKQLREYYQKSFLRVLYDSQIDVQDKELLREMIESQREASPTDIANQFLEVCANKNYFKRNIVMYVINLKRK
ncbi:Nitrogen_fixation protein NifW [Hexamita inflata]|uniref:Nitrogen fixation protein NifW n=1 Tax=Hexamita inflata TaxID=28002 RepID=A0AA86UW74_9EUKA|nr:Nitrogen fixation protein NifW [Hexamita inflata]